MDILVESAKLKKNLEQLIEKVVESQTRSSFRLYKAIVVVPPNLKTGKCAIRLVGENTILNLPFTTAVNNCLKNDIVWVGVPYNSFRNAIVFTNKDFNLLNIPIATEDTIGGIKSQSSSITGTSYPVEVNVDGTAQVTIPLSANQFIANFEIDNWIKGTYDGIAVYYLNIPQNTHGLTNPYVSSLLITSAISDSQNINITQNTDVDFSYTVSEENNVEVYINIDLNNYEQYNTQIILKE